jgi:NTP pyrophosphatase (non-canonical NTP hydrolase)
MKNLINRNHNAVVKRGCINKNTTIFDFLGKLKEEVNEVETAINNNSNINEEFADVMCVCFSYFKHNNVDIEEILKQIVIKNESRIKN